MLIQMRLEAGRPSRVHRDGADADLAAAGSQVGRAGVTGTVLMLIQMRLEARQAERGAQGLC